MQREAYLDEIEFAWACGLFEGEGSVVNYPTSDGRRQRRLQLWTTDADVLRRFQAAVGSGTIGPLLRRADYKPIAMWQVARWVDLEPLLRRMLPYMGTRRAAAMDALLACPPRFYLKITAAQRDEICASTATHADLARRFGVDPTTILRIRRKQHATH